MVIGLCIASLLSAVLDLLYGAFYYRYLLRAAPLSLEHAKAVVDAVLAGIGPTPWNRQL